MEDTKLKKCKYSHPDYNFKENKLDYFCVVDGWEDDEIKRCNKEQCEKCEKFKSKYIEYPLTINEINNEKIENYGVSAKIGSLCEIKPCNEKYNDKTFIGIYLGEMPIQILSSFNEETRILTNSTLNNPAIFVPELKKIIYGCESWWKIIEKIEDFKNISNEDIENTWYVKLLKNM